MIGALVMLYIQLLRVLLTRPKRGKVFWGITIYSGLLFTMASIAAGGKIKYAEYVYIASQFDPIVKSEGLLPSEIFKEHASKMVNVMSRVRCEIVLFPDKISSLTYENPARL